jgi:hypothetical protein
MNYVSPEQIKLAIDCAQKKLFEADLTLYNRIFSVGFMTPIIINYLAYEKTIKDTKITNSHKQLAEKTKPTDQEIAEMNDKFLIESFEYYKKFEWFEDPGNTLHDLLVISGKIKSDSYIRFIEDAKDAITYRKRPEMARNNIERLSFKNFLSEMELKGGVELEIMAKKICLNKYFEKLINK